MNIECRWNDWQGNFEVVRGKPIPLLLDAAQMSHCLLSRVTSWPTAVFFAAATTLMFAAMFCGLPYILAAVGYKCHIFVFSVLGPRQERGRWQCRCSYVECNHHIIFFNIIQYIVSLKKNVTMCIYIYIYNTAVILRATTSQTLLCSCLRARTSCTYQFNEMLRNATADCDETSDCFTTAHWDMTADCDMTTDGYVTADRYVNCGAY
jgi:hypothetical protein